MHQQLEKFKESVNIEAIMAANDEYVQQEYNLELEDP